MKNISVSTIFSAILKPILLIAFLFTFAQSKVHGYGGYDGSYSDHTTKYNFYNFMFGTDSIHSSNDLKANGLMICGFVVLLISLFFSIYRIFSEQKKWKDITLLGMTGFCFIALFPFMIVPQMQEYNKGIGWLSENKLNLSVFGPGLSLVILVGLLSFEIYNLITNLKNKSY